MSAGGKVLRATLQPSALASTPLGE